jgi:hypothetical protein
MWGWPALVLTLFAILTIWSFVDFILVVIGKARDANGSANHEMVATSLRESVKHYRAVVGRGKKDWGKHRQAAIPCSYSNVWVLEQSSELGLKDSWRYLMCV